ncbi:hypothetical protein GCM10008967_20350 [Bacillus carboniphilus]|uniref:histidine kinase n=1 Tax=Bacillus carboniphilus TaxID=86663 RepID=A0ABP3FZQ7_9BACI
MRFFHKLPNLLSKFVILNGFVIFVVILLAGLSVKDYACFLVNTEQVTGQELVQTLNQFLWTISIFTFLIVGFFHFITVKKILRPIQDLSLATQLIKEGKKPIRVEKQGSGELKELTESFYAMSDTLFSVQEQRDEMLKDIAHELRTPLTNINGYLEALESGVIEGKPELFGSLLEESRRITRIVELITEMNTWSNNFYQTERNFEDLSIHKVLSDSLTSFQLKLEKEFSNISLEIKDGTILGNKDGLMQVFSNILQNILDYNIGESLTIQTEILDRSYRIHFQHKGQHIDSQKKELIFERFNRLEESRTTRSSGAGLGLAISKSIVQAHNGEIGLDTNGTDHTFWIELPLIL